MKKKQVAINKKSVFERFSLLLVLLSILIMSVAHAQISDIELKVTGQLNATLQEGVFISDINASTNGAITESVKYYRGTTYQQM